MTYVKVQLDDGAVVDLSYEAAEDLYDLLWLLAPTTRGALTTAAKLQHVLRAALARETLKLDFAETTAFVAAHERL